MRTGMPPVMRAQMHQQMYPNAYQQYIQEQGRAINGFVLVVQFYSFLNCQEILDRSDISLIFVFMNPDFDLLFQMDSISIVITCTTPQIMTICTELEEVGSRINIHVSVMPNHLFFKSEENFKKLLLVVHLIEMVIIFQ